MINNEELNKSENHLTIHQIIERTEECELVKDKIKDKLNRKQLRDRLYNFILDEYLKVNSEDVFIKHKIISIPYIGIFHTYKKKRTKSKDFYKKDLFITKPYSYRIELSSVFINNNNPKLLIFKPFSIILSKFYSNIINNKLDLVEYETK